MVGYIHKLIQPEYEYALWCVAAFVCKSEKSYAWFKAWCGVIGSSCCVSKQTPSMRCYYLLPKLNYNTSMSFSNMFTQMFVSKLFDCSKELVVVHSHINAHATAAAIIREKCM